MHRPTCSAEQADGNLVWVRCGIVFEQNRKYHPRPGAALAWAESAAAPLRMQRSAESGLRNLILPPPTRNDAPRT